MDLQIHTSVPEEKQIFIDLFLHSDILPYFPMHTEKEIEDSARVWEIFCKKGASLTSFVDGKPCGFAFLNLQPYKKFAHQCLITIIVDEKVRGKGIGTKMMHELMALAKDTFHMEMLHLEVYGGNPAIRLYERLGFITYGISPKYIKEPTGTYTDKILMEKYL